MRAVSGLRVVFWEVASLPPAVVQLPFRATFWTPKFEPRTYLVDELWVLRR